MVGRVEETREVYTENSEDGSESMHRESVSHPTTAPGDVVAQRVVWYVVGVIIALLLLRLLLQVLGANQGNAFVDFIYSLSGIFAAPFFGIFSYTPTYGQSVLEVTTLVAIAVYALIGWGVARLFTLGSNRVE